MILRFYDFFFNLQKKEEVFSEEREREREREREKDRASDNKRYYEGLLGKTGSTKRRNIEFRKDSVLLVGSALEKKTAFSAFY